MKRILIIVSLSLAGCAGTGSGSPDQSATGMDVAKDSAPPQDATVSEGPGPEVDSTPSCAAAPPALKLTPVAGGLSSPVFVTGAPGDAGRLYIVEQGGRILVHDDGALKPEPFLDVSNLTKAQGERGLLGLAFHPEYAANGLFYIDYTDLAGRTIVAEYRRSQVDDSRADPGTARVLLSLDQPYSNHNGGMVAFGPDGLLYVGMGDGGSGGDPQGHAQDHDSLLGKILRIDPAAHPDPPPGNMAGGNPYVWDLGLRNPWRFSFDRDTGDLYIGDVGQGDWEEIDVEAAGKGHANYGWNVMEGTHCYDPPSECDASGLTLPVDEYDHSAGCSVTGGYVYRGSAIECLKGWYLYGDYCSNRVWAFRWNGKTVEGKTEITADLDPAGALDSISSFGEDDDGNLYVVSHGGTVHRIDAGQ